MMNRDRPVHEPEFRLAKVLDATLLETLGATADMPRGRIVDLIKEYLCRRGRVCAFCGKTFNRRELYIDHRKPSGHGGLDNLENLQLLCIKCSQFKGKGTMLDARKRLRQRKSAKRA
jgi:5-methylcytosine-specific restriction endonuclease McrA